MSLGERVRQLRQALDPAPSQQELSRSIGADPSYISRVENGYVQLPRQDLLQPLARALNTSVADLLHHAGYLPATELRPIAGESGDPTYQELLRRAGAIRDPDTRELVRRLLHSVMPNNGP